MGIKPLRIGIDLMGSDKAPALLFKAVEQASKAFPQVIFLVLATQKALGEYSFPALPGVEYLSVADVIEMHDEPLTAIRQKKNSSLALGIKLLKKRFLDGFVSAGNTGALIAGATLSLPRLPGIKRPALLATLPTQKGVVAVIDVGGNVSCKAYHLAQFAELGAAYQRCCYGIDRPRIGLLNIGVESKKGTSEVRRAYEMLQHASQQRHMQFVGNVEGRDLFHGGVDVLVTDGFTGNVLLKTSEGVSSFVLEQLGHAIQKLAPELLKPILNTLHNQFDFEEYNGAIICGVDCVAVKCHGQSSPKGFFKGIQRAVQLVQNGFLTQIKANLPTNLVAK